MAPINIQMSAMEKFVFVHFVFYLLLKCDKIEETLVAHRKILKNWVSCLYGRSTQCGRSVGAQCSMGLRQNPLINGLIQPTFKLNILFLEKITVIPFD